MGRWSRAARRKWKAAQGRRDILPTLPLPGLWSDILRCVLVVTVVGLLLAGVAELGAAFAGCGLPVAAAAPAGPPLPPTDLTVRIVDRRATSMEVCWSAGAGAETFEVRYARVPINPDHFDDFAVTSRAPFTGRRRHFSAGERVCQLITGLYIETGYYFAVRAVGDGPPMRPPSTEPNT